MDIEICIDSFEGMVAATNANATRVELCSALEVGGLTPSFAMVEKCANYSTVEVYVMIRPRSGDFFYNYTEIEIMKNDIIFFSKTAIKGVVFGFLDSNYNIDERNKELVDLAHSLNLKVTFHRAIDFTIDYEASIKKIIELGFDRILTSGKSETAYEGIEEISKNNQLYGDKIEIMAGSGINKFNVIEFKNRGIKSVHFTAKKVVASLSKFDMGANSEVDLLKISDIKNAIS